jgi:hypothetical protein
MFTQSKSLMNYFMLKFDAEFFAIFRDEYWTSQWNVTSTLENVEKKEWKEKFFFMPNHNVERVEIEFPWCKDSDENYLKEAKLFGENIEPIFNKYSDSLVEVYLTSLTFFSAVELIGLLRSLTKVKHLSLSHCNIPVRGVGGEGGRGKEEEEKGDDVDDDVDDDDVAILPSLETLTIHSCYTSKCNGILITNYLAPVNLKVFLLFLNEFYDDLSFDMGRRRLRATDFLTTFFSRLENLEELDAPYSLVMKLANVIKVRKLTMPYIQKPFMSSDAITKTLLHLHVGEVRDYVLEDDHHHHYIQQGQGQGIGGDENEIIGTCLDHNVLSTSFNYLETFVRGREYIKEKGILLYSEGDDNVIKNGERKALPAELELVLEFSDWDKCSSYLTERT